MKKQYFGWLLFGLIVLAGLVFTACPEEEMTVIFTNMSMHSIDVICPGADPSSFNLPAKVSGQDPSKKEVTKTGSIKYGWNVVGHDYDWSLDYITATKSGTGVIFTDKI